MKTLRRAAFMLLAFLVCARVGPIPNPPLPGPVPVPEAPPALFQFEIGDAAVEFSLSGSWKAELAVALGIMVTPLGVVVYPSPFPGLEVDRLFSQAPDLTFSVWLMKRYFLEGSVVGDFSLPGYQYFDDNYLLMGYKGGEGQFLRSVLLGSRKIDIDSYPFLVIPETGSSSIGASARMGTGRSDHQVLLRYDNNEPNELIFLGQNLVEESELSLETYIRGRFFRLPDAGVDGLQVYIEDDEGAYTGTDSAGKTLRYRLATVDDAVLDAAGGLVQLKQAATGSVLVYYTKGSPIGTPGLGLGALSEQQLGGPPYYIDLSSSTRPFNWGVTAFGQLMSTRQVTITGLANPTLRLWKPGEFSPFEYQGYYQFPRTPAVDLSRVRVQVMLKGAETALASPVVKFLLTPGADAFEVYRTADLRGDLRNLYPFLDEDLLSPVYDPDNLLYGPSADPSSGYVRHELLVSLLTPLEDYRLGTDVVPGSVRVLRNGLEETRFEVDYDQGIVTFRTAIAPSDRLEISFRRRLSLAGGGDLLFAWGNTIPLSFGTLELATGVRWNLLPGSYTEEAYTRTGSALLSVGLKGQAGPLSYEVSAAGAFTNPDTTGIMRLLGMEGQGMEVPLFEDVAYPAAAPADPVGGSALTQGSRGQLIYKDYRDYGTFGTSSLMPWTWPVPAEQQFAYASGSKIGPYQVAGSSEGDTTGQSLALDFQLAPGEWVGTQLPVPPGQALTDLSLLRGFTLSYRAVDVQALSDFDLYLQIGDTDEDLDGDGVLEAEPSASSPGFLFHDSHAGVSLRVGSGPKNVGNNRLDSEDVDGSGQLDHEVINSPYLVTRPIASGITVDTGWNAFSYSFTQAELDALRRSRTVRVVAISNAATSQGRVLIDRITLEGSRFWVSGTGATVREVEEWAEVPPLPSQTLEQAFPEVQKTFHPFGEVQKVLEVQWAGDWKLRGFTQAASEGIDYRRIVYYYRLPAVMGGTSLNFSLLDSNSLGVRWTLPVTGAVNAWSKVEVSLDDRTVSVNGSVVGTDVTVDSGYYSLTVFEAGLTGTTSGTLYLDEVHLANPKSALGAAGEAELELKMPGALLSWGGHAVVHDLTVREKAWGASKGFSPLYGTPEQASSITSRTELSVGLSIVDLKADLLVSAGDAGSSLSGGHSLAVPNIGFPVAFADAFSLREEATGRELSRSNRLRVSAGPAVLDLKSEASSLEDLLSQTWSSELLITPPASRLYQRLDLLGSRSGFAVPEGGYFQNWIQGYTLLAPWTGGQEVERLDHMVLDWSLLTRPLGAELSAELSTRSYEFLTGGRTQKSTLAMALSFPMVWAREQVTRYSVTPGYRRTVELVAPMAFPGNLIQDLGDGFNGLGGQRYWFSGIPGIEIYAPGMEQTFLADAAALSAARYVPEVFLSLSRLPSSRLIDLFLPFRVEASMDKEFRKDGDLFGFTNHYRLALESRALNLFGAYGAYPLFPFYRTDEFSSSVEVLIGTDAQVNMDHYLAFDNPEGGSLSLRNRFRYQREEEENWSDTVGAVLSWKRVPSGGIRLPLIPRQITSNAYWQHGEGLDLAVAGGEAAEGSTIHPLNLILSHETSLVLPEHGYLKARVSLGADQEQVPGEGAYWRLGLRAALEAQIQF